MQFVLSSFFSNYCIVYSFLLPYHDYLFSFSCIFSLLIPEVFFYNRMFECFIVIAKAILLTFMIDVSCSSLKNFYFLKKVPRVFVATWLHYN